MTKKFKNFGSVTLAMLLVCASVITPKIALAKSGSEVCEDQAMNEIYKILAADKDKVVNKMFEITNLKLALYLSGKSKTVEEYVHTKIADLKDTVSKSDVPAKVKAVYSAHNTQKVDKVKEDLDSFVKHGQDACYYSPSLRLRNDDVASFVTALRLKGEDFSEEDVAIYWMAEKLRKSHVAASDKSFSIGQANGNNSNASSMIARYLGGVDAAQTLSPDQIKANIAAGEKSILEDFQKIATTDSIQQSYTACMHLAGQTCDADSFATKVGSMQAKEVIKNLSSAVTVDGNDFDEQKLSEKIGAKACARIAGKPAPVNPSTQHHEANSTDNVNTVTKANSIVKVKPPERKLASVKDGNIDAYFPMDDWEKRTPNAPNNRRAYGVDPRTLGDIKPRETLADFFKKHAKDNELGPNYEQFGSCHVGVFQNPTTKVTQVTLTNGYNMKQLTGMSDQTEASARDFCSAKKGTLSSATAENAALSIKDLTAQVRDFETKKKNDPTQVATINYGACKIRMYNAWSDKTNAVNDPTSRGIEVSRSGAQVLKGNLDLGCVFYNNCQQNKFSGDYDGLSKYLLAACK